LVRSRLARGEVRTEANHRRAGRLRKPLCKRRMVAVGVRDNDVADGCCTDRLHKRFEMRIILRPRINDREGLFANQIGVGAVEGEGAWIVDRDATDTGGDFNGVAVVRFKFLVEFHSASPLLRRLLTAYCRLSWKRL